ncbi:hypothetical protein FKG94_13960 [Exilibacterium tricleocarpae]|uniref:histidine kinase n=1 Tax=Exilibacterium tricleocarpae TaxID=2591008 RepID=A0A545TLZ5_9GAMM|nr:ATP-binding protein [Exilibacterium tricleocarpae]TQV78171.1 hypothetical protein FKG94_13960 [Exilibacterium tricleocarpae]
MNSIRQRLYVYLTVSLFLVWLVLLVSAIVVSRHFVIQQFDARLKETSGQVRILSREIIDVLQYTRFGGPDDITHELVNPTPMQIYRHGILVIQSRGAPSFPFPAGTGFKDVVIDGEQWRALYEYDSDYDTWVINGQRLSELHEPLYTFVFEIIWPIFVALPVVFLCIYVSVRSGTALFKNVTQEIQSRAHDKLDLIATDTVPLEIKPLIVALNDLLVRLDSALTSERRFTDNAAHELRTPLAALKTEVQVARRGARSEETVEMLDRILVRVKSAAHLVTQLLDLSRVNPNAVESRFHRTNLQHIVIDVLSEMADCALDRNIDLSIGDDGHHFIVGQDGLLSVLVRNLVDNAIKYTPSGGRVSVQVADCDDGVALVVADSGPGISDEVRESIYDPFFRGPKTQVAGSGLGMSIVKRIADLHKATVTLTNLKSSEGFEVRIIF